jgi:predicted amidophosphoribosyltransferase
VAESAGRYCPLCGEAAGLVDRFCRRCGESLQAPAPGVRPAMANLNGEPTDERSRRRNHDTSRRWQGAEGVDPES